MIFSLAYECDFSAGYASRGYLPFGWALPGDVFTCSFDEGLRGAFCDHEINVCLSFDSKIGREIPNARWNAFSDECPCRSSLR